jgi:hypothetical protein
MPTPSLILVPARFKTGKLYTPVATTSGGLVLGASGDFNVTRATTATRVNASGLIEVVASGIPRLDYYTSGGTAGCPALLVEPSGSNLALQSEAFNTTWSPVQLLAFNSGSVINTTGTLDPYGTNVADLIVPNAVSDQHRVDQTTTSVSGSYTFSVFMKAAGYNFGRLRIGTVGATFNLASGTIGSTDAGIVSSIQPFGNGWYRCVISKASSAANEVIRININQALTGDYSGNGTSGLYVFGAQYETGSVATSYIPTTTAAVTRNADVITLSGAVSGCIGQTEGTIYLETNSLVSGASDLFCFARATTNTVSISKNSSNIIQATVYTSGPSTALNIAASATVSGNMKIAFAYKSGSSALYINGVQIGTSATAFSFTAALTQININPTGFFEGPGNQRLRTLPLYTTRLTNAELAALTT